MTQSKYLVLICALFFLCQGCEEDFGILQIVPLAIGNNWIYSDSTFYGQDSLYVSTHTHSVVGKRVILHKNNTVEVFLTSWGPLCLELDGLYSYGINEDEPSPNQYNLKSLVIRYPVNVGDSWTTQYGNDYGSVFHCISLDGLFATPAGTFHCVVIGYSQKNFSYEAYYCPGIGFVGDINCDSRFVPIIKQKTVLISYSLR